MPKEPEDDMRALQYGYTHTLGCQYIFSATETYSKR